ncbi:RNA polymerase sigma-70 factor [Brevibacillus brevis]|uniref:RNA polymerase sigma-70 factor n=1 Tax=Brevibacillus brevis TaxID=1393 RepID=UPI000D0EF840|nr:RNA polymerase sigma-70 factor [Brevibacillus brevis]PSJ65988.1 RNA polymerase subunit sigma-24 [Brevibacillus brevis]RED27901.1 RNA polymerase sigma-70 factor (ECF subfamily) [Brevibacillus brevis]GEC88740.1 RNA polymerase sigma factor SigJ [Brevibacillus brevis]VEF86939.1 RNA polymerase sigma factor SigJ [Brevibacillus brevis]
MEALYKQYKGLMFRLAYQMLGSATDAEDIVQDVFVKSHDVSLEQMSEPKAYLCKMTTNRCLDLLKSARKKRELYTGPWLPEPISTPDADSYDSVIIKDLLSYAMLVLLERLSPAERAVFVLREAFDFQYDEIAELVGKTEANCRKIVSRAKKKMGIDPAEPHLPPEKEFGEEWIGRFLSALEHGNVETLLTLLATDAVLLSDGGGKVTAALHPILSGERVASFLLGLMRSFSKRPDFSVELAPVNNQTGFVIRQDGRIDTVVFLHIEHGVIRNLYFVRNPDKLRFIES